MQRKLLLLALAAATWICCAPPPAAQARPWPCLPPLFDAGQRLHPLPTPRNFWLQILLRQHELCRSPDDEVRVLVLGNSAVYGLPLPAADTFASHLNRHLREIAVPAQLYNLGFVTTYQLKDALILHEALAYQPDVVVWPLTRDDFQPVAPIPYPTLIEFFARNRTALAAMIANPPHGLEEPLGRYARSYSPVGTAHWAMVRLREMGAATRSAARVNAAWLRQQLHSPAPLIVPRMRGRRTTYDCEATKIRDGSFVGWQKWNVLAELEHMHNTLGIEILVVNWPVAHEPIDDCYNVRYTNDSLADFVTWMAEQSRQRGLPFVDLHQALPPESFVDSIHVTAEGHRQIAQELAPALDPILRAAAARKGLRTTPR